MEGPVVINYGNGTYSIWRKEIHVIDQFSSCSLYKNMKHY
jgi:hypothetical protein